MEMNHRILVVCEDPGILDRIGKHLCEQSFDVQCASNSAEALTLYLSWQADLVITDSHMAGMNGMELIEAIQKINRQARYILITPPGETPEFMRATRSRVIAFLGKPFNPEDLMHFVRRSFSLGEVHLNRREYNRRPFSVDTQCVLINPFDDTESRPVAALVRDVSRAGLSMIVRQVLPVPSIIRIVFHLPMQQNPVNMLAKSVSCTLTQITGVYRLGAKFIGFLPEDMEHSIIQMRRDESQSGEDIYMGKSLKEAVREWLLNHQAEFSSEEALLTHTHLADLAMELCRDSDQD
jgi:CheY-like chemotaxis protein